MGGGPGGGMRGHPMRNVANYFRDEEDVWYLKEKLYRVSATKEGRKENRSSRRTRRLHLFALTRCGSFELSESDSERESFHRLSIFPDARRPSDLDRVEPPKAKWGWLASERSPNI